ncbi:hypothetical protein AB0J83_43485 [Actinoplanes sp. NPDC049596]|uniref:hypothetical protein n=1 Tax=unclassified Actinoplanes TaxID=2626549 RepID=UPI003436CEDD
MMPNRFAPHHPPTRPNGACIQGEFTGVVVTEEGRAGASDLVVESSRAFGIVVSWRIFGNLVPIWLTALTVLRHRRLRRRTGHHD